MLNTDLSFLQAQLQHPHIFRLRRAGAVPSDPDDEVRMGLLINMLIRSRENYWNQWANGMLDDDTYLSYRETLLAELETGGLALEAWSFFKTTLVPGFVEEIDRELVSRGREASPE